MNYLEQFDRLLPSLDASDAERLAAWQLVSSRIGQLLRHPDPLGYIQARDVLWQVVSDLGNDAEELDRRSSGAPPTV